MTRQEAIDTLIAVWQQRDHEACCRNEEHEESEQELVECLIVLGITKEEIRKTGRLA